MKNTITSKQSHFKHNRRRENCRFTAKTAMFISIIDVVDPSFEAPEGVWSPADPPSEEEKRKAPASRADLLFVSLSKTSFFFSKPTTSDRINHVSVRCVFRVGVPEGPAVFSLPDKNN